MKGLLLLLFLKMVNTEDEASERINNIVFKYKYQCKDNPEFCALIEQLNHIGKTAGYMVKEHALRDFQAYDKQRLYLEENICFRIDELDSFFPDRSLSEACVADYLDQKKALSKFKNMSNEEKQKALQNNSRECYTVVVTTPKPPPTKTPLITTSTAPGVNQTLITTSTAPGVNQTMISTTTAPGVNMALINKSTEPEVTVTLTGTNTDSRTTSTDPGETGSDPGETSTNPGKGMILISTKPMPLIFDWSNPWTTMTSSTSPGITINFPNKIKSPYVPIINHC